MEYYKCLRCGHKWLPRKENPACCPNCKSRVWNKPKELKVQGDIDGPNSKYNSR